MRQCEGEIGMRRGGVGDGRKEGRLQSEMSLPTGCSFWNSGHVTFHRRFVTTETAWRTFS